MSVIEVMFKEKGEGGYWDSVLWPAAVGFFGTVKETFRDLLGEDWTPGYEQAWQALLADLAVVVARPANAA